MTQAEKTQSIRYFRTLQIIFNHSMSLMDVIMPGLLVLGDVLIGSLLFSAIKFHNKIDFYLEIALIGICSMGILILNKVLNYADSVHTAHVQYPASMLAQRSKLSRLERCYYRAFPTRPIRVPYLLTVTKRTFLTVVQTVFYNVISLLLAFP